MQASEDRATAAAPQQADGIAYVLPESFSYRLKTRLLGRPLVSERLSKEKLSKVLALGVLSPDCISSTAYGTEEMLNQIVPVIGVAAFALLLPITAAILLVLFFVTLSYREVVMVYTKAGGSYVVSRENFGPRVAQVAAVALIIDYILTVAVQTAAGTDALVSAIDINGNLVLNHPAYSVSITVAVVLILMWGNLRGIREAGKTFALPTYLFITGVGSLVIIGLIRAALGQLHAHAIDLPGVAVGHTSSGLFYGAGLLVVLRAFANGGSSLTGLEAISNGVATFRRPEGRNARRVLVVMSTTLGTLVLGVSLLAWITHAVPYVLGNPTVLSQEAHYVFGSSLIGKTGFYYVQAVSMLILYTGANTSFNGFPNLASFVAEDAYLPRWLTRRGHRLVFSNGIVILAVLSIALLVATRASVNALVALYAIGVFVGFTMAGSGMVKHHLTHKEQGWRHKLVINGFAAGLSGLIVGILAVVKFTQGAWLVVVLFPILFLVLIRLHKQYTVEKAELEQNAALAATAPALRRHAVLVFVERLDLATARALQYARTLLPDELRAVHFVLDTADANTLRDQWTRLGLTRFPLELVECPDRRLGRAAMELVAETGEDGQTEVSVLLPRRVFAGAWQRVLHDRTAERIASLVSQLPHATATIVPFPLGKRRKRLVPVQQSDFEDLFGDEERATPTGAATRADSGAVEGGAAAVRGRLSRAARWRSASAGTWAGEDLGLPATTPLSPEPGPDGAQGRAPAPGTGATAGMGTEPGTAVSAGAGGTPGTHVAPERPGSGAAPGSAAGEQGRTAAGGGSEGARAAQGAPGGGGAEGGRGTGAGGIPPAASTGDRAPGPDRASLRRAETLRLYPGTVPIGELRWRQRARVYGRVRSVRVQSGAGVPSVECILADRSGQLLLVFQGRRRVPGIEPGARLVAEGMVGERGRRTAMINPLFTIVRPADGAVAESPPPNPPDGGR